MTFKEQLASLPEQLNFKDCLRHPIQFIRFSKASLKQETSDWKYDSHTGISLPVFIITFSFVFSLLPAIGLAFLLLALNPLVDINLLSDENWYFLIPAAVIGIVYGFRYTISHELEEVNKTLARIRMMKRLERIKEDLEL